MWCEQRWLFTSRGEKLLSSVPPPPVPFPICPYAIGSLVSSLLRGTFEINQRYKCLSLSIWMLLYTEERSISQVNENLVGFFFFLLFKWEQIAFSLPRTVCRCRRVLFVFVCMREKGAEWICLQGILSSNRYLLIPNLAEHIPVHTPR